MATTRRAVLLGVTMLAGCATPGQSLDRIKIYADAYISMVDAGTQVFIASVEASVSEQAQQWLTLLDQLAGPIQNAPTPAEIKSLLIQVIGLAQQLSPLIAPFLGPAAVWVQVGLAVLLAFVQMYKPPPDAPTPSQMYSVARRLTVEHPEVFR